VRTYDGEWQERTFEILVDGTRVGEDGKEMSMLTINYKRRK